jgi:hypothetical protein
MPAPHFFVPFTHLPQRARGSSSGLLLSSGSCAQGLADGGALSSGSLSSGSAAGPILRQPSSIVSASGASHRLNTEAMLQVSAGSTHAHRWSTAATSCPWIAIRCARLCTVCKPPPVGLRTGPQNLHITRSPGLLSTCPDAPAPQVLQQEVRKNWRRGSEMRYLRELTLAECIGQGGGWRPKAAHVSFSAHARAHTHMRAPNPHRIHKHKHTGMLSLAFF